MESTAMGLMAGIAAHELAPWARFLSPPPGDTCVGALLHYITSQNDNFQPMKY